jgi:hypothetical protein
MSIRTDPNNPFVAAAVAWNGKLHTQHSAAQRKRLALIPQLSWNANEYILNTLW